MPTHFGRSSYREIDGGFQGYNGHSLVGSVLAGTQGAGFRVFRPSYARCVLIRLPWHLALQLHFRPLAERMNKLSVVAVAEKEEAIQCPYRPPRSRWKRKRKRRDSATAEWRLPRYKGIPRIRARSIDFRQFNYYLQKKIFCSFRKVI